jgi:DNA repair photolyase
MAPGRQMPLFGPSEGAAQRAEHLDGGVIVREVRCKTLLNRCRIDDYSFNCYTGCGHACGYCYARFMQRFHPHAEAWGRFVDVKVNAVEVLTRQLRRLPPGQVFTSSACDGWQAVEEQYRLTRECCRRLLDAGFSLGVLTKSRLVLRDFDLFAGRRVRVGVTITTTDERWARVWEPGASPVADRVEVLRQAKARGLVTAVMFGPLLPGISDTDAALGELFALAAAAKVDHVWTDILNPRPRVAGWDSFVLVWGADSENRADLCLAENGSIAFLRFRINLRRRSRGFLNRVISLAAAEDWLLLARDSRCLLPPEPAAVLADMERSDAARCVSDPEKFIREVRGDEPDWPRDRRVYCPAECREHELRVTWVPAGSCATALFRTHNPKDEHERLQPA